MKFYGREKTKDGGRCYRLFGIPILKRVPEKYCVHTYWFGIRTSTRKFADDVSITDTLNDAYILRNMRNRATARVDIPYDKQTKLQINENEKEKISILFDGEMIQVCFARGMGIYGFGLLKALAKNDKLEILLLCDDKKEPLWMRLDFPKNINVIFRKHLFEKQSEKPPFDFYFATTLFNPFLYAQLSSEFFSLFRHTVGILHDMIPPMWPHLYPNKKEQLLCFKSVALAQHIFTNSKCTAFDGQLLTHRPSTDFTVLYGAPNEDFFAEKEIEARNNDIVTISGKSGNKNYSGTINAFCKAYASGKLPKDARLVFANKFTHGTQIEIQEHIKNICDQYHEIEIRKQIILQPIGYRPTDAEIAEWVKNCRATIFASYYEGLGLPILESYAANTPCIGSNTSSVEEITAPQCQFDVFDTDSIAQKIIEIYNSPQLREKSLVFGKMLLSEKCNWDIAAQKVITKLQEIVKKGE